MTRKRLYIESMESVFSSTNKVLIDQQGGNALMYAMSERDLHLCKGKSFTTPIDLLEDILDELYEYGKENSMKESVGNN